MQSPHERSQQQPPLERSPDSLSTGPSRHQRKVVEAEFEQLLSAIERSLRDLKQRHAQIQRDQRRQLELRQQYNAVQREWKVTQEADLLAELRQIQQELDVLEVALESRLLNWGSFREVFWQAVRFGGLGVVIGWILKSCVG